MINFKRLKDKLFLITNSRNAFKITFFGIKITYTIKNEKNKVILYKKNGLTIVNPKIEGLKIIFNGENSIVELYEPLKFVSSKIIMNNNCKVVIQEGEQPLNFLNISMEQAENSSVFIGKNFRTNGTVIEMSLVRDISVTIGDDCMFSCNTLLRAHDSHTIFDLTTKQPINTHEDGIHIGNHVWVCQDAKILKNVSIADNTIVGLGSIVTKSFVENNCILAGIPAKIIKKNVNWDGRIIEHYKLSISNT